MKRKFFKDSYYDVNSNIKRISFIYPDLCYCGHEKNYHSNLDKCNSSDCECKRFIP